MTDQISLSSVFQQYKSQHYYEGIVELSISSASSLDSRNLAQHFYKAGQPPIDTHGRKPSLEGNPVCCRGDVIVVMATNCCYASNGDDFLLLGVCLTRW